MQDYAVIYIPLWAQFQPSVPDTFFCVAANADDAQSLCSHSNPGCRIIYVAEGVDRREREFALHEALCETLDVGDPVYWRGPDGDPRAGICIFHGQADPASPYIQLESYADWVDVLPSEVAIAPARPEDRLARVQQLASDYLGLAQQVIDAAAGGGDPDSPAGELLATISSAEQLLSEIGIADFGCGSVTSSIAGSRAA